MTSISIHKRSRGVAGDGVLASTLAAAALLLAAAVWFDAFGGVHRIFAARGWRLDAALSLVIVAAATASYPVRLAGESARARRRREGIERGLLARERHLTDTLTTSPYPQLLLAPEGEVLATNRALRELV